MAVIAYASANADPINNPSTDAQIDLSSATVPTSVTLYGGAQDTQNPSASFSWSWSLQDPTSSGLVLSSTTTQNITVSNIQNWENIRLFLVATNTATSESSESNVLLAPSASFVQVKVLSQYTGLQKPAKGARDWHTSVNQWAGKIEDIGGASPLNLGDLADVSSTTGAELDILTSGNNAEQSNSPLHLHDGDHIGEATASTRGTVLLESSKHTTGTAKLITEERLVYTQSAERSNRWKDTPVDQIIFTSQSTSAVFPHCVFLANEDIYLERATVTLLNGGSASPNVNYIFDVCVGTTSDLEGSTMTKQGALMQGAPSVNNGPLTLSIALGSAIQVQNGRYFGICVLQSPQTSDAGFGMRVTIDARRRIV